MRTTLILLFAITTMFACGNQSSNKSVTDASAGISRGQQVEADGDASKAEHIVISKQDLTLSLYDSDKRLVCRFPVAVGKNLGNKRKKGDLKTPEGEFTVQQIQPATSWGHDFGDGKGWIDHCYGNWFIRLKTPPHTGIGIHGTHAPESIGTRATEGCIRLENSDLDSLKPMVKVGMRVTILSSDADREADAKIDGGEKAPQPKAEANTPAEGELWHTIESGDTMYALSQEYGTTEQAIKALNPDIDPLKLQLGQKIRVR